MRGVTLMMMDAQATTFISTHTPHARRDIALQSRTQHRMISTHTPHARRDRKIYEHFTITPQHIGGLNDKFLSN